MCVTKKLPLQLPPFLHGGTGLQCHCWVSTLPSTGLQKSFISRKYISQYLLCLERNKRNEKMSQEPWKKRDEEGKKRKKTSNMCFFRPEKGLPAS